jgi:hypothetical protein
MDDRAARLRQARLDAGFETAAAAAEAHGWNRNTYASNENGNASFSFRKAETNNLQAVREKYSHAKFLCVSTLTPPDLPPFGPRTASWRAAAHPCLLAQLPAWPSCSPS